MSWVCRFSALSARWKASQPTSMKAPITPSQMNLLPLAISIFAVVFEKPLAITRPTARQSQHGHAQVLVGRDDEVAALHGRAGRGLR